MAAYNFLTIFIVVVVVGVADGYSGKVLLVSMDGFRWDYINHISGLDNFNLMAKQGCTVDYVNTTFSTKTFPGHYSIVTGLYEENHGIVANSMYDPDYNATFSFSSTETFWWNQGEPIWITAEKQKRNSTAVCFWPGSEAEVQGLRPSIYLAYNHTMPFTERVERALNWFAVDKKDFVAMYFNEPDSIGHTYGPDSPQVADVVRTMDKILGLIFTTMHFKKIVDVNVIITSDHGMTDISMVTKLIDLWDFIDRDAVERVPEAGTVTAILPKAGREDEIFANATGIPHATAYRKEGLPADFHYKHNSRVMPIIILSEEGWTLSDNVESSRAWNATGNHGYGNELPSMKPIFFATGPNFKKGARSTSIRSVDIYPLLCELLGLTPAPNNGTLTNTAQFLVQDKPTSGRGSSASEKAKGSNKGRLLRSLHSN